MWNRAVRILFLGALAVTGGASSAQEYPARPVRIIVPYAAGGPTDVALRIVADRMHIELGQPVVVENRPGAGGAVASELVARAPSDGYTLLFGASSLAMLPAVSKINFDPVKDFAPISEVLRLAIFLVVRADVPARTVPELVAYLKANPGKLSYGSAGVGSVTYFQMEQFKALTHTELLHVPYKSTAQALTDLVAGRLQVGFDAIATSGPYIQKGTFRALAVALPQRTSLLPNVPTMAEAGLPGHDAVGWAALLAPAGTSRTVIDRVHAAVVAALGDANVQAKLRSYGAEPASSTPEELGNRLRRETVKWYEAARRLGIQRE